MSPDRESSRMVASEGVCTPWSSLQAPFPRGCHHLDMQPTAPGAAAGLMETYATLGRVLIAIGVVIFTLLKVFGSFLRS